MGVAVPPPPPRLLDKQGKSGNINLKIDLVGIAEVIP
jgi:hypothetical protein